MDIIGCSYQIYHKNQEQSGTQQEKFGKFEVLLEKEHV
jgi:hypothetical protein